MTADIFPSYILEPKKIVDNITWFLNPIAEPPQKFLQILPDEAHENIYSDLIEKEEFIIKNVSGDTLFTNIKPEFTDDLQKGWFNLIFSLANEKLPSNFEIAIEFIHDLLKPSSYFIFETKIAHNLDEIKTMLLKSFESVNFLVPWSDLKTNPFSSFDSNQHKYCWVVALSQSSDEDPGEWMNNF